MLLYLKGKTAEAIIEEAPNLSYAIMIFVDGVILVKMDLCTFASSTPMACWAAFASLTAILSLIDDFTYSTPHGSLTLQNDTVTTILILWLLIFLVN